MTRGDRYHWRILATGFCFALFGFGGAVLAVLLPLMALLPGSEQQRQRRARRVLRAIWRSFVGVMHRLGCFSYEIQGLERLSRPGHMIVANHPSLIDVVFLISFVDNATCIVKDSLRRNPASWGAVRYCGLISNADSSRMVDDCVAALRRGETLIIFPEGTRTVPGTSLQFHRGAANIALRAEAPITMVSIHCDPPMLLKNTQWYQVPPRRGHYRFQVGESFHPRNIAGCEQATPRAARILTRHMLDYFTRETAA